VVEAAEADVVGPAVAADDPHAAPDQVLRQRVELAGGRGVDRPELLPEQGDAFALLVDAGLGVLVGCE